MQKLIFIKERTNITLCVKVKEIRHISDQVHKYVLYVIYLCIIRIIFSLLFMFIR